MYLYDENRHVHCCELTPSYECWLLYITTENKIDDETDEVLSLYSNVYSNPVTYFHVPGFASCYDCGNDGWSLANYDSYDELVEAAREYYQCNHVV